MTLERFTVSARRVYITAVDIARKREFGYVGDEDLLLALLASEQEDEQGPRVVTQTLETFGWSPDRVQAAVIEEGGTGDGMVSLRMPFSGRATDAMNKALAEATDLGHGYVYPEHLFLGLLSLREGVTRLVLNDIAPDHDLRKRLLELFEPETRNEKLVTDQLDAAWVELTILPVPKTPERAQAAIPYVEAVLELLRERAAGDAEKAS
jgi:ATP-dependent Clp protease ATP-binding subunit ClpA